MLFCFLLPPPPKKKLDDRDISYLPENMFVCMKIMLGYIRLGKLKLREITFLTMLNHYLQ